METLKFDVCRVDYHHYHTAELLTFNVKDPVLLLRSDQAQQAYCRTLLPQASMNLGLIVRNILNKFDSSFVSVTPRGQFFGHLHRKRLEKLKELYIFPIANMGSVHGVVENCYCFSNVTYVGRKPLVSFLLGIEIFFIVTG